VELADSLGAKEPEGVAQAQRPALVRATVEHGEELAADVEDADGAAIDVDDLPLTRRNLVDGGDDPPGH
jgi:hypothetical protein